MPCISFIPVCAQCSSRDERYRDKQTFMSSFVLELRDSPTIRLACLGYREGGPCDAQEAGGRKPPLSCAFLMLFLLHGLLFVCLVTVWPSMVILTNQNSGDFDLLLCVSSRFEKNGDSYRTIHL